MYTLQNLKKLFEEEKCELISNCLENILKYKCCCGNDDISEITLNKFLKGIRCNGYSCKRSITTPPSTKVCVHCDIEKSIDEFPKETRQNYMNTHKNTCRPCSNIINDKYRNTQVGYFKKLLKAARRNSRIRGIERPEAGIFDISYDNILDIWKTQDGKCYYSNVPMKTNSKTDFQASIERLDSNKGYIKDNIVLCALEFNDVILWSREKIIEMLKILKKDHDLSDTDFTLRRNKPVKFEKAEYDEYLFHQCNKCFEVKSLDQFNKNKSIGCKSCVKILDNKRFENPRDSLFKLLTSARSNSKTRAKKNLINDRDCSYDLDLDQLIEIYRRQGGLCAYSGLPLCFGNSKNINWKISLERKNTKLGYNVDNVCLICYEFNTGDKTILYKETEEENGSCGWSNDKFKIVLESCMVFYQGEF
jgi:hypothetical protein